MSKAKSKDLLLCRIRHNSGCPIADATRRGGNYEL
jgi:hypothetical protein